MKQIIMTLMALLLMSQGIVAQDMTCPAVVQTAVESTQASCAETGSGEICYGSDHVSLVAAANDVTFAESGAIVPTSAVQSLQTSALDTGTGQFGIAIMRLPMGLSDPQQTVLMVLFGDTRIENRVESPVANALEATATGGVNIRAGFSTNTAVIGGLAAGQSVTADGRNEAGDWLHIQLSGGESGWVFAPLFETGGSVDSLPVIADPSQPPTYPLQEISLRTSDNPAACGEAQVNGLLIQTPANGGTAHIVVDGADVWMDGTFYLEAADGLKVSALDGVASVASHDVEQRLYAGAQLRVPLDAEGMAADAPVPAGQYDAAMLVALPLALLDRPIAGLSAPSANQTEPQPTCQVVAANNINLRGGPGTVYPVLDTLEADTAATVSGQAQGVDGFLWWQLANATWVRSDVVTADATCEAVPVVEVPPEPTPGPSATIDINYFLNDCRPLAGSFAAGQNVEFYLGGGGWQNIADARNSLSGLRGVISVDGEPLVAAFSVLRWGPNDYGVKIAGLWTATSGTHQISGSMSLFDGTSASCTITVP